MPDIPRLNPAIRALESGKPAFVTFSPAEIGAAQSIGAAAYDGVVFEMEHNPYDIRQLRDCMQYMLDRAQILKSRQPRAGRGADGAHPAQWRRDEPVHRQAGTRHRRLRHRLAACLDRRGGAQRGAGLPLSAAARGAYYEPAGQRGDAPRTAARYWGIDQQTYYKRADTWPLNPEGEVLVVIMCEEKRAIRNLPQMLKEVPGIGVVLIGEGDLSQDMGYPRQYEHPEVAAAIDEALAICKDAGVPCGHPHVDANNVEELIEKGFRWLMPAPSQSFAALEKGLKASGRK